MSQARCADPLAGHGKIGGRTDSSMPAVHMMGQVLEARTADLEGEARRSEG